MGSARSGGVAYPQNLHIPPVALSRGFQPILNPQIARIKKPSFEGHLVALDSFYPFLVDPIPPSAVRRLWQVAHNARQFF